MPLYRCSALLLAAGAVASVAASADSVVFINNISYPICPESGTVTVKCAAKTTFASAELYELHEVDSIVCSSYILLPAENVWSTGLRSVLYFFALLYLLYLYLSRDLRHACQPQYLLSDVMVVTGQTRAESSQLVRKSLMSRTLDLVQLCDVGVAIDVVHLLE